MVLSESEVWEWLAAWRRDIDSVPMPTLISTDTARALLAGIGDHMVMGPLLADGNGP